ncbi:putative RNA-directed DNA polymerase from transposon BS [Trichonephila clavipes]|nr:putative RNA-directed DNA polymerase from transposon BS [Trichonephila clavipes]
MGLHYSTEDKVNLFADSLESSFQENPESYCRVPSIADSRTTNSKLWRIVKKINKEQEQCEESNSVIDTNGQGLLTARTSASNGLLDLTKSPGPDGIFGRMLENLGHRGKLRLLDIINLSWKIGRLPAEWKRAIIIPIKKAGKKQLVS